MKSSRNFCRAIFVAQVSGGDMITVVVQRSPGHLWTIRAETIPEARAIIAACRRRGITALVRWRLRPRDAVEHRRTCPQISPR
ncbi:hypothetical protein KKD52_10170 [Myxococcota bacterium]|nr:hypothetical protein [Myxococcota bacterium]